MYQSKWWTSGDKGQAKLYSTNDIPGKRTT